MVEFSHLWTFFFLIIFKAFLYLSLYSSAIIVLYFANKVVTVQHPKFVCSLYPVQGYNISVRNVIWQNSYFSSKHQDDAKTLWELARDKFWEKFCVWNQSFVGSKEQLQQHLTSCMEKEDLYLAMEIFDVEDAKSTTNSLNKQVQKLAPSDTPKKV